LNRVATVRFFAGIVTKRAKAAVVVAAAVLADAAGNCLERLR
jgi:hypothetical protein